MAVIVSQIQKKVRKFVTKIPLNCQMVLTWTYSAVKIEASQSKSVCRVVLRAEAYSGFCPFDTSIQYAGYGFILRAFGRRLPVCVMLGRISVCFVCLCAWQASTFHTFADEIEMREFAKKECETG